MDELDGGLLAGGFCLDGGALLSEVFAFGVDDLEEADEAGFVAEFGEAGGFAGGGGGFFLGGKGTVEVGDAGEGIFDIAEGVED